MINLIFNFLFQKHKDDLVFWKQLWKTKIELYKRTGKTDWDNYSSRRYYKMLLEDIENEVGIEIKNKKILEMGAGSGLLSLLMAAKGAEVYLVDILPEAIEYMKILERRLRDLLPIFSGSVKFIISDFNKISKKDVPYAYFDLVHNAGVIEECNIDKAVSIVVQMKNYVKQDGNIIVAVPNFFNPYLIKIWLQYGKGTEIFYTKFRLKEVLFKAGYSNIKVFISSYIYPFKKNTKLEYLFGRWGFGFLKIAITKLNQPSFKSQKKKLI